MLYSGADLIRTSGHQVERLSQLRAVDPVKPVDSAAKSESSLDSESKNALLRFARFVHKEKSPKAKKPASPPTRRSLGGYLSQIESLTEESPRGGNLDVYV